MFGSKLTSIGVLTISDNFNESSAWDCETQSQIEWVRLFCTRTKTTKQRTHGQIRKGKPHLSSTPLTFHGLPLFFLFLESFKSWKIGPCKYLHIIRHWLPLHLGTFCFHGKISPKCTLCRLVFFIHLLKRNDTHPHPPQLPLLAMYKE